MKIVHFVLSITAVLTFTACGTSKKLQQATNENAQLKEVNASQQQKITAYETQISQLKEENISYSKEAEDCRKMKEAMTRRKEKFDKAQAERGTSLEKIEEKAEIAVQKFGDAGCDVTYKNGRFHVIPLRACSVNELIHISGTG